MGNTVLRARRLGELPLLVTAWVTIVPPNDYDATRRPFTFVGDVLLCCRFQTLPCMHPPGDRSFPPNASDLTVLDDKR